MTAAAIGEIILRTSGSDVEGDPLVTYHGMDAAKKWCSSLQIGRHPCLFPREISTMGVNGLLEQTCHIWAPILVYNVSVSLERVGVGWWVGWWVIGFEACVILHQTCNWYYFMQAENLLHILRDIIYERMILPDTGRLSLDF